LLDAAQAHAGLANILLGAALPGAAEEARSSLKYAEWMGPARPPGVVIDARTLLGMGLVDQGQVSQGLAEIQRAYADSRELRGDDHRQTGIIANLLGKTCMDAGDVECALTSFEASYESVMRQQAALGPFAVAMAHFGLGSALNSAGRYDQALPHFSDAAVLFAEAGGPAAPRALRSRSVHAYTQIRLGKLAEADKEFASVSAVTPFDATEKAANDGRLALLRSLQGRHDEALRLARSAADGLDATSPKSRRAKSLTTLGTIMYAAGQAGDAVVPLEQAVALYSESQVPGSPDLAEAVAALARAHAATAD
jgi:tetratricopeptide (TPR) repeat protein